MTDEAGGTEAARLRAAYARRGAPELGLRRNRGQARIVRERDASIGSLLRACAPIDRLLDLGCGDGSVLASLLESGFAREGIGVDVLEERIAEARLAHPDIEFRVADGIGLPFESAHFDVVLAMTVFSSIADSARRLDVLREIRRVLRPGGALIWYDMRRRNPFNPDVRPLSIVEIETVFDGAVEARAVTLLPQLARRLGALTGVAYPLLASIPLLRTHTVGRARRVA